VVNRRANITVETARRTIVARQRADELSENVPRGRSQTIRWREGNAGCGSSSSPGVAVPAERVAQLKREAHGLAWRLSRFPQAEGVHQVKGLQGAEYVDNAKDVTEQASQA
jgi:hypothetical protein